MVEPKQIVEEIRKIRFGIGFDTTNLTEEQIAALKDKEKILKDASKLAREIHTRNPRFIFELIQNAEDNEYENPIPTLRFIVDSDCLIIQNNERGFEEKNVWALCGIGETTKTKALGYIGEKGIGFKSVFMVADKVEIYSNGFQFQFWHSKKNPLWEKWEHATMIIPGRIDKIQDFVDPNQTNIVLHLKPEIRNEISGYLEDIHPSLLLFLRKLKVIEVEERDKNEIRKMELQEKNGIVEIVYDDRKSRWKVVKKSFNVPQNIDEERRRNVNETEIILAFPLKEDYSPDTSNEQFVFAFLPVRKYGFKFIIQADFLLPVTREDIIKDNKWNEWLRDSIAEVFLEAIGEFKKDEKLKYRFYDYLPLEEEVKDEFFLSLIEQIYEKLKEEESILTEANKWKKPSKVLIGDEEIKKIIKNEDLQRFLGKEYLSEKIKAKKPILHKLGVRDFSVDELLKCLENTEWIKKQNDGWFANLFSYLSKKKLSNGQLERLKSLKIIKLENGELTSINGGVVFFPLEKKEAYGFESELKVIKKDIIDTISKYEKEERDSILEFLKKLGLKQADPYEIIENHILPVYENGEWKQKDSKVLIGYIRYIKDNIDKYEKESDRRLNANKSSWEPKEDPLKRLKKSLLIRIDNDTEGKEWYDNPENVYLPKIYGNQNYLEKLFEGIDVSFVHPCYVEGDLEKIDREINELENKLKGKSKKWKKKHRKEVKRIEEQLKKIEDEKNKKIKEWREFFLKIGVWDFLIVKRDPQTEIYEGPSYANNNVTNKAISKWDKEKTIWKNENWNDTDWKYYIGDDWLCEDFGNIIDRIKSLDIEEKITITKKLCSLFSGNWRIYKNYAQCDYYYRSYGQAGWSNEKTKSTFLLTLLNTSWIPTTQNTLVKPSEVFINKPEIREVLGDTVPYLAVEIKNEDFVKAIGINIEANVEGVLNYLKALAEQKCNDKNKFEKLYGFLNKRFEDDEEGIRQSFSNVPLIYVPNTEKMFFTSREVLWKDVSEVFGENRAYLEKHYPKLKYFFVEKLGVSEKPSPEDYADVLCSISEKTETSDEDKKVIIRIYEELNRNLNPDRDENPISQEDWWNDFIKKRIFLTDKSEFWSNDGDIFINDNNELYELFKDEEDIGFLWLPEDYHPDKIKFFIKACNLCYLSESVEIKPLVEEVEYSKDGELTQRIQSVISYVLQYLYWKENEIYEKIKENGMVKKMAAIEVYAVDNLRVEYSLKIKEWRVVRKEAERKCIYHNGSLYLKKDEGNIYDLAVEFSKAFGEIKGLDDFVMNIINNLSNAESIMKAKNIGELPEKEREFLKEIYETGIKRPTEKEIQTKEEEKYTEEEYPEKEYEKEHGGGEHPEEEEWRPEIPAKKVPIQSEEYPRSQEAVKEVDKNKTSVGKVHSTGTSKSKEISQPKGILSEKIRKDIGREGEKYALYSIIRDKLIERLNIEIEGPTTFEDILNRYAADIAKETNKGFNLEKDGNVIVEVIWLNKNGESGEHYDIKVVENGEEIFIEVKSTKEYGKAWFPVSKDQWRLMGEKGDNFYIYRVYGAGRKDAKIQKIRNPAKLWKEGQIDAHPISIEL